MNGDYSVVKLTLQASAGSILIAVPLVTVGFWLLGESPYFNQLYYLYQYAGLIAVGIGVVFGMFQPGSVRALLQEVDKGNVRQKVEGALQDYSQKREENLVISTAFILSGVAHLLVAAGLFNLFELSVY